MPSSQSSDRLTPQEASWDHYFSKWIVSLLSQLVSYMSSLHPFYFPLSEHLFILVCLCTMLVLEMGCPALHTVVLVYTCFTLVAPTSGRVVVGEFK